MYAAKEPGKGRSAVFAPEHGLRDHRSAPAARPSWPGPSSAASSSSTTSRPSSWRPAGSPAWRRWSAGSTPTRGLVPPLDFIPLAEQTGLIVPIGRVVLREACRQMSAWHRDYPAAPPMTVSVNLSARELDQPGLVAGARAP